MTENPSPIPWKEENFQTPMNEEKEAPNRVLAKKNPCRLKKKIPEKNRPEKKGSPKPRNKKKTGRQAPRRGDTFLTRFKKTGNFQKGRGRLAKAGV